MSLHVVSCSHEGVRDTLSAFAARRKRLAFNRRDLVLLLMVAIVFDSVDARFRDGLARLIVHNCRIPFSLYALRRE
jgi:hypothetical protein